MSEVLITNDGIFRKVWVESAEDYVEYPATIGSLRLPVEIQPGTTLGDIFKGVQKIDGLTEFLSDYSSCPAKDFHEAALEPPTKPDDGEVDRLIVSWVTGHFKSGEFDDLEFYASFYGRGKDDYSYSVSHCPMNELVHLPVLLDKKITLMRNYKDVLVESTHEFTLLDFLDAIYWDISFHGGPADNKKFIEMLTEQVEEIKNGNATIVPFELPE